MTEAEAQWLCWDMCLSEFVILEQPLPRWRQAALCVTTKRGECTLGEEGVWLQFRRYRRANIYCGLSKGLSKIHLL